jgi:hypothetical protein
LFEGAQEGEGLWACVCREKNKVKDTLTATKIKKNEEEAIFTKERKKKEPDNLDLIKYLYIS